MSISGKKLLVLGGSRWLLEIVNQAKKMGLTVYVTDNNPASPCKKVADKSFDISAIDVDGVAQLCKEEHIDGVITGFVDMLLPYYAQICEKTGLPCYGSSELFSLFTNKAEYKKLCREYGVPVVEEYDITLNNFDREVSSVRFPVIVKPVDDSGSRGITICSTAEELKEALLHAADVSHSGRCIVERYMDTDEVMVYWVFDNGEYYLSAVANRHVRHLNGDKVIPSLVGFSLPSNTTTYYIDHIAENVKKMLKSQNIKNGMMFMQCKVEDNVCYVFDIGYRLTGSLEYHIIEKLCGYNTLEAMIRFAVTGNMGLNACLIDPLFKGYGYSVVGQMKPGFIADITGIDEIAHADGICNVFNMHVPGDTVSDKVCGTLMQVCYRIHGTVGSKEEIYPAMEKVHNGIRIISDSGENLILPGVPEEEIERRVD